MLARLLPLKAASRIYLLYWYKRTSTDAEDAMRSGSGADAPETTRKYSEFSAPSPQVLIFFVRTYAEFSFFF